MKYDVRELGGIRTLELFRSGVELRCPICNEILEGIPKDSLEGAMPVVIKCPIDDKHYFMHFESASEQNKIRERMLERAKANKR